MSFTNYLILTLSALFYYFNHFLIVCLYDKFPYHSTFIFYEYDKPIIMLIIFFIYLKTKKERFYRHQKFSLLSIVITGIINYILLIFFGKNRIDFRYYEWIIIIISFLISSLPYSILVYLEKLYMKYKYYSPLFISFYIGAICSIVSVIWLIICYIVGNECMLCGEIKYTCTLFIIISICTIINNAINFLLQIIIINNFTIVHFLMICSFGDIISIIFYIRKKIVDYDGRIEKMDIINISIKVLQVILCLIFLEIIELNFCGLNENLKKYIIRRSVFESKLIIDNFQEFDDDNNSNSDQNNSGPGSSGDNSASIYD